MIEKIRADGTLVFSGEEFQGISGSFAPMGFRVPWAFARASGGFRRISRSFKGCKSFRKMQLSEICWGYQGLSTKREL